MKKLFTLIAVFLLGTVCFAQMPSLSSVNVRPITANYAAATPTVTFEVSWPDDRNNNRRSKVWVFVDYRRIKDNAYAPGWSRAEITVPAEAITATAGTVSREDGNTSGFWLQGTDGAFATTVTVPVTVDLEGYAREFGWCGWAIDGPPTAKEAAGYYSLHGTPPFIIQTHPADAGQTVTTSSKEYIGCIYALTDTTRCPGEPPAMPAITDFAPSTTAICVGESITLTATATNAEQYSFDNGVTWGNSASTVVSPATTTDYILKATREKGACTVTSPTTITVTVNPAPVVTAQGAPFERCGTGTIDLRVAVTVDNHPEDDVTIHWYDNDEAAGDPLATGATCSPTLSALNTYYYVGATVNATGCASTSLTKVTATVILDEGMIGGMETE